MSTCENCGRDDLEQIHKFCRRCGIKNPSYVKPEIIRAEPTETEIKLAKALFTEGVNFIMAPEIRLSSCVYYTPDFLIEEKFIVEIDGQIHNTEHQILIDRIRQRALENSGYPVFRFTNMEVKKSITQIVNKIISISQNSKNFQNQSKIIEIDSIDDYRYEKIDYKVLEEIVNQLNMEIHQRDWASDFFKEIVSKRSENILSNRCAIQKILLSLLGLNFKSIDDRTVDFQHYANLFGKAMKILEEMFGKIATVEFRNFFNITATNFLKNIVIYGKPRKFPKRLVHIKFSDIENLLQSFNSNFSRFGISVDENDLKIECMYEKNKIRRIKSEMTYRNTGVKVDLDEHSDSSLFEKISNWELESSDFTWKEEG